VALATGGGGGRHRQRGRCWSADEGNAATVDTLFAALYADLLRSARAHMRKETPGHTLSATALTHEAWFRLSVQTRTQWKAAAASWAWRRS
jgi:hypothetical protein